MCTSSAKQERQRDKREKEGGGVRQGGEILSTEKRSPNLSRNRLGRVSETHLLYQSIAQGLSVCPLTKAVAGRCLGAPPHTTPPNYFYFLTYRTHPAVPHDTVITSLFTCGFLLCACHYLYPLTSPPFYLSLYLFFFLSPCFFYLSISLSILFLLSPSMCLSILSDCYILLLYLQFVISLSVFFFFQILRFGTRLTKKVKKGRWSPFPQ